MRSLSREKKKDGETNDRRERERRDSMQEQGKISLRRKSSELTRRFFGISRMDSFVRFWTKLLVRFVDRFPTKENQREKEREDAPKKEEERKENNSDVLSRCVLQSTKLFLTFRIFYRHDPFDDHAPKRACICDEYERCDSSRKRTKVREEEEEEGKGTREATTMRAGEKKNLV